MYLDHEVVAEAPARFCAFLPQCPHVILESAQVLGEGHKKQSAQLRQEWIPWLLRARRLLQGIQQSDTPERDRVRMLKWNMKNVAPLCLHNSIAVSSSPCYIVSPQSYLHLIMLAWKYNIRFAFITGCMFLFCIKGQFIIFILQNATLIMMNCSNNRINWE